MVQRQQNAADEAIAILPNQLHFEFINRSNMAINEIKSVTATGIALLLDDIDTDRIIPARFLRCVTFDGLGEHAFEDDRLQDKNHPFDKPEFQGAGIMVAGRNFGGHPGREGRASRPGKTVGRH